MRARIVRVHVRVCMCVHMRTRMCLHMCTRACVCECLCLVYAAVALLLAHCCAEDRDKIDKDMLKKKGQEKDRGENAWVLLQIANGLSHRYIFVSN